MQRLKWDVLFFLPYVGPLCEQVGTQMSNIFLLICDVFVLHFIRVSYEMGTLTLVIFFRKMSSNYSLISFS